MRMNRYTATVIFAGTGLGLAVVLSLPVPSTERSVRSAGRAHAKPSEAAEEKRSAGKAGPDAGKAEEPETDNLSRSERNPAEALFHALNSGRYTLRHEQTAKLLRRWAAEDPAASEAWLNANAPESDLLIDALYAGLCAFDFYAAWARYAEFAERIHPEPLLRSLVCGSLEARSVEKTLQWLGGLSPEQFEMAMPQVIFLLAESDPLRAGTLVADWPEALPKSPVEEIASARYAVDPSGAFEWAETIRNSDVRRYALGRLFALRVEEEPAAAAEALAWVDGIREPGRHNRSLQAVAPAIARNNPDVLSAWLMERNLFTSLEREETARP